MLCFQNNPQRWPLEIRITFFVNIIVIIFLLANLSLWTRNNNDKCYCFMDEKLPHCGGVLQQHSHPALFHTHAKLGYSRVPSQIKHHTTKFFKLVFLLSWNSLQHTIAFTHKYLLICTKLLLRFRFYTWKICCALLCWSCVKCGSFRKSLPTHALDHGWANFSWKRPHFTPAQLKRPQHIFQW